MCFFVNKSKLTEINSPTVHPHKENIKLETCPEGITLAFSCYGLLTKTKLIWALEGLNKYFQSTLVFL